MQHLSLDVSKPSTWYASQQAARALTLIASNIRPSSDPATQLCTRIQHLTGMLCRQSQAVLEIVIEKLFKAFPALLFGHITNLSCLATPTMNACCAVHYKHYWELTPTASSLSNPFQTSQASKPGVHNCWPPQWCLICSLPDFRRIARAQRMCMCTASELALSNGSIKLQKKNSCAYAYESQRHYVFGEIVSSQAHSIKSIQTRCAAKRRLRCPLCPCTYQRT